MIKEERKYNTHEYMSILTANKFFELNGNLETTKKVFAKFGK